MGVVHFDFETRSKVDIREGGAGQYALDPSTRILCFAYCIDDGPIIGVSGDRYLPLFDGLIQRGYVFAAHNAYFEYMIWKHVWKRTPPPFKCTMAKACAHGLPWQLEQVAQALKLGYSKDVQGTVLINRYSKPKPDGSFTDLASNPEDAQAFVNYCKQDVQVERALDNVLPNISENEQEIFDLTIKMNSRGIAVDEALAQAATDISESVQTACNTRVRQLTEDRIFKPTQTVRLKNYLNNTFGLELSGVGADVIEEVLPSVTDPKARELLLLRLEYGRSSVAKFRRVLGAVCADGRIRDYLVYHGASTGRWTSKSVQLQNLPRGGAIDPEVCIKALMERDGELFNMLYKYPMSALSECIRGVIIAGPGKTLMIADYNAIEARVLMWLAGQKDAIEAFRQGRDIYVEMARVIHGNPKLTKADKAERQLGKQAVLGCGYQMGHVRFQGTCAGYGMDINEELAQRAVEAYRETYKHVPAFWYRLENAAKQAIRGYRPVSAGPVTFFRGGRFLYARLPSGRCLAYYNPGIETVETKYGFKDTIRYFTLDSVTRSFKKTYTYGGKLAENVTQAVARDLMADAMLRLEDSGRPVVLSVHDEVVCEVDDADVDVESMIEIMCELLPNWAFGCPVTAEGFTSKRYRK